MSSVAPGQAVLTPTLPDPMMINRPPAAVHVPMPMLPLVTTKEFWGVVVPKPMLVELTPLPATPANAPLLLHCNCGDAPPTVALLVGIVVGAIQVPTPVELVTRM